MIDRLYKLIWLFIHLLACLYETIYFLQLRLQALINWSYDHIWWHNSAAKISYRRDLEVLESCKQELTKVPQHLNLVIGPEALSSINIKDFERILWYALTVGIQCVSIYDVRSESAGRIDLDKVCASGKSNWKQLHTQQFEWSPQSVAATTAKKGTTLSDGYTKIATKSNGAYFVQNGGSYSGNGSDNGSICNGYGSQHNKTRDHLKIYQLTEQNNRPLIAKVCRELFEKRNTSDIKNMLGDRKQLEQKITDELAKHMQWEFADPELCIIFNTFTCTYGVLPWQTRFTEFHTFEPGRCINAENFARVLYRYSKCEQRWGK